MICPNLSHNRPVQGETSPRKFQAVGPLCRSSWTLDVLHMEIVFLTTVFHQFFTGANRAVNFTVNGFEEAPGSSIVISLHPGMAALHNRKAGSGVQTPLPKSAHCATVRKPWLFRIHERSCLFFGAVLLRTGFVRPTDSRGATLCGESRWVG